MTDTAYHLVKKALLKKKQEVKASPAAAKKFLEASGLADVLENAAVKTKAAGAPRKKAAKKKIAA
jgi:hypothetical protein